MGRAGRATAACGDVQRLSCRPAVAAVNRWFAGLHQARGQALYGSISFGAGGMLGGLLSGWAWESLGAELTFSLSSVFALAGMIILWRGWRSTTAGAVV